MGAASSVHHRSETAPMTRRLKDALDQFFTDIHNSLLYAEDPSLPKRSLQFIRDALEAEPETPSAETPVRREEKEPS
jgi:hypothetical protein